jgi:hypothetical protein
MSENNAPGLEATEHGADQLKGHAYYQLSAALGRLDGHEHGFGPRDIVSVEAFWADASSSSAGFVGPVRDGRRYYLECHLDDEAPAQDARINVQLLPKGQTYPEFKSECAPHGGWSNDTRHFNGLLASAGA